MPALWGWMLCFCFCVSEGFSTCKGCMDTFRTELGFLVNMHGPVFPLFFYLQKELFVKGEKEANKVIL